MSFGGELNCCVFLRGDLNRCSVNRRVLSLRRDQCIYPFLCVFRRVSAIIAAIITTNQIVFRRRVKSLWVFFMKDELIIAVFLEWRGFNRNV